MKLAIEASLPLRETKRNETKRNKKKKKLRDRKQENFRWESRLNEPNGARERVKTGEREGERENGEMKGRAVASRTTHTHARTQI